MSDTHEASRRGDEQADGTQRPISEAFRQACVEGEVADDLQPTLWALHLRGRGDPDDPEVIASLLADHSHWRLYLQSRAGDEEAAAIFRDHWTHRARGFFRARFSAEDAEDLTGVFFERVHRLIGDDFAWSMPFAVYLQTMLLNLARDHVGRLVKRRERETSLDAEESSTTAERVAIDAPTPEQQLLRDERSDAMRRAIWALPAGDRCLLFAVLLEERSPEEVGEELGLSRNAIYQRLHRAREKLKKSLEKEGLS
ncbi:MAG: sigma-70 family RNA polymerase sigma factor [Acidobacteriota bacterium]